MRTRLIWGCLPTDGRRDDKMAGEWKGERTGEGSTVGVICFTNTVRKEKCCQHWPRHFPGEITSLDCQWDRRSPATSLNQSLAVISECQAVGFVISRSPQAMVKQPWPELYRSFCSFGGRFRDPLCSESSKDTRKKGFGWSVLMTSLKDITVCWRGQKK